MKKQRSRKFLAIMLVLFFVAGLLPMGAFAGADNTEKIKGSEETVVLSIGQKNYVKGNRTVETDIAPYIKDNRTMVPVAFAAPALGTEKAIWHPEEEKVTIKKGDTLITIFIGSNELLVNDKKIKMDTIAEIADLGNGGGRTMLPIAFIARALETGYEWQEASRTVHFYGKTWVYDKAGTYGPDVAPEVMEGNIIVKADGVSLQNMKLKGNLTIAKEVKKGTVKLNNVSVAGETFVRGGGKDSIHINGGEYGKVHIQKEDGKLRIVVTNSEGVEVVISEDAKGEEIILNGIFEQITVEAKGIKISTQGETKIEKMEVTKDAQDVEIELSKETVVKEAILESNADIRGEGKIEKAEVKADNVNLGVKTELIEVAEGTGKPTEQGLPGTPSTGGGIAGGIEAGGSDDSTPAPEKASAITITGTVPGGTSYDGAILPNEEGVTVTLTTATQTADIYYTLDGSEPSKTNGTKYTNEFIVNAETTNTVIRTIKAIAVADGYTDSDVATLEVKFSEALPKYTVTFNVVGENGTLAAAVQNPFGWDDVNNGDKLEKGLDINFTATPDAGYQVKEWKINGDIVVGNTTYNLKVKNLDADITVTVETVKEEKDVFYLLNDASPDTIQVYLAEFTGENQHGKISNVSIEDFELVKKGEGGAAGQTIADTILTHGNEEDENDRGYIISRQNNGKFADGIYTLKFSKLGYKEAYATVDLIKNIIEFEISEVKSQAKALIDGKSVNVDYGKGEDNAAVLAAIKALGTENAVIQALTTEDIEIAEGRASVDFGGGVTAEVIINEG